MDSRAVRLQDRHISALAYDADQRLLVVEFAGGKQIAHYDVPSHEAQALFDAPRPKNVLIHRFRGRYKTRRVDT